ncbi:MAG: tyrosine-type recombinase/integrase [Roseovarius sp.]|nr:tyrosine-type recombinase/integrase [Roseovarius sp.]
MSINTLEDVFHRLPEFYSESSCDAYRAAFRRAERLTGKRLCQIPADERSWGEEISRLAWAGEFRARTPAAAERAFHTWCGKITAAIRRVQAADRPDVPAEAATGWARLVDYVAEVENTRDVDGRLRLPNMASVSMANLRARLGMIPPQALDQAAAAAALHRLPPDKTESFRNSVAVLDRLIRERDRHAPVATLLPTANIGPLPKRRDAPIRWQDFPAAFLAARDSALDRAVQSSVQCARTRAERIDARREGRRRGRRPARNPAASRRSYLNALSWLIRHAADDRAVFHSLESLDPLLTEAHVEAAAQRYVARCDAEPGLLPSEDSSSLRTYLSALTVLARAAGIDEMAVLAIEDIALDPVYVSESAQEMSTTRERFVRLIDRDSAVARAIITGPETLLCEAEHGFDRWARLGDNQKAETLHLAIAAAAMAVQLARPLRTRNVNEAEIGGESADLLEPRRAGAKAWIAIDKRKVKNRRAIEGPVPDRLWRVVETWRERGRPAWIARHAAHGCRDDGFLFPGTRGGPMPRSTFNKAWNRGMGRLGLNGLTPHMMRHVAATLYLAVQPGDYGVVAALLCDTLRAVEKFYMRGEGRAAAELFAQVMAERFPALDLGRGAA